jgi:hypothetical protein
VPVVLAVLLLALLGGGGYYYTTLMPREKEERENIATARADLPPPVPRENAPDAARPSSQVRSNMVENVVRELGSESRAVNRLNTPYQEMTTVEKINYEVLFGRNVFDMITKNTPPGIRFRSLEIEDFQTVYFSGAGISRRMVEEMFVSFRDEHGDLLPRPYSHIKDDPEANGYFSFVVTHKPRFGLEVSDPFQALDHLGFRDGLPGHLRNFSRIAGANNFRMSAAPSQMTAERVGNYRRVIFRATGMSTYKDFHQFVLALYNEKVPCAFKRVSMTPVRDEQVRVNLEILFTVRE